MGFWFLLYLNNTDEKAQTHSIDARKMLKVETLMASFKKTPFKMWLDGMIIVIFAEQYIIEPDIYLAFYAPVKRGLYFESGTLNISYFSINLDLNIS